MGEAGRRASWWGNLPSHPVTLPGKRNDRVHVRTCRLGGIATTINPPLVFDLSHSSPLQHSRPRPKRMAAGLVENSFRLMAQNDPTKATITVLITLPSFESNEKQVENEKHKPRTAPANPPTDPGPASQTRLLRERHHQTPSPPCPSADPGPRPGRPRNRQSRPGRRRQCPGRPASQSRSR